MKKDLLSLYLKYDTNFSTISKIALGELIVKIIYFANKAVSLKYISNQLLEITGGSIPDGIITEAICGLKGKIDNNKNKYQISPTYVHILDSAKSESVKLHHTIFEKYFSKTSADEEYILNWFQSTTIILFEKYNFEWFHIVTSKKAKTDDFFDLDSILNISFSNYHFSDEDKSWLNKQYKKFVAESDTDADNIFWQYGLSAFSSRLINASNFANKINIDSFRNMTFLLDTNVLMILGLEKHKLNHSISILENCFNAMGVKLEYLYITQEEYRRAIDAKRNEVYSVFEEYDENVLFQSDCPFIKTALARHCRNGEDVKRMFEDLNSVPEKFSSIMDITIFDNSSLADVVEKAQKDNQIKTGINSVYYKYKNRNKREPALLHDSGLIGAGKYLRETKGNYTILTNDTILKIYASHNLKRDNISLAIGLDVIIGLLTVGGGNVSHNSTDFAPLFKNIIQSSLMPSKDIFQVEDLAFMLAAHLEINKLSTEKVVEIAKVVNQKLSVGEDSEKINLYLRREIEGDRLQHRTDIEKLKETKEVITQQRDNALNENKTIITNLREIESKKIKRKRKIIRWTSYICFIMFLFIICLCEFFKFRDSDNLIASEILTFALFFMGLFPFKNMIRKYYSENDDDIENEVERRIERLRKKMESK